MTTIKYDIKCCKPLVLGYVEEIGVSEIEFEGFTQEREDTAVTLNVEGIGPLPLVDMKIGVDYTLTHKEGTFEAFLMEKDVLNTYVRKSNPFDIRIKHNGKIKELAHEFKLRINDWYGNLINNLNTTVARISKKVDEIRPYTDLTKVNDYLYEISYNSIDYAKAIKHFEDKRDGIVGGCTGVRKGNFVGRNFDWIYNDVVDFVVTLPRIGNKYASISISGNMDNLTKDFMNTGKNSDDFDFIPFYAKDGINEKGVFIEDNVVPTDKEGCTEATAQVEERLELCGLMLVRYVLDTFDNATTAVEYIRDYVSLYTPKYLQDMHYTLHFMIGDAENTYILEVWDNQVHINSYGTEAYMTNFYVNDITRNEDGTVYTPETKDSTHSPMTTNGITAHGCGLERFNIIVNNIDDVETQEDMTDLMDSLFYTTSYERTTTPCWYTEFVDGDMFTVDTDKSVYDDYMPLAYDKYEHRSKDPESPYYGTWQTSHSSIYDIARRRLTLRVQECTDEYVYKIDNSINDVILTSPNGTNYKLVVDNNGVLTTIVNE